MDLPTYVDSHITASRDGLRKADLPKIDAHAWWEEIRQGEDIVDDVVELMVGDFKLKITPDYINDVVAPALRNLQAQGVSVQGYLVLRTWSWCCLFTWNEKSARFHATSMDFFERLTYEQLNELKEYARINFKI